MEVIKLKATNKEWVELYKKGMNLKEQKKEKMKFKNPKTDILSFTNHIWNQS